MLQVFNDNKNRIVALRTVNKAAFTLTSVHLSKRRVQLLGNRNGIACKDDSELILLDVKGVTSDQHPAYEH